MHDMLQLQNFTTAQHNTPAINKISRLRIQMLSRDIQNAKWKNMNEFPTKRSIAEIRIRKIPLLLQPFLDWGHDPHHEHVQMFSHWESTCSRPKQFCNLHREYLMLLRQHMLFQLQLYVEPSNRNTECQNKIPEMIILSSGICFTSRLPASPKYTGRSSARPTATRSLHLL